MQDIFRKDSHKLLCAHWDVIFGCVVSRGDNILRRTSIKSGFHRFVQFYKVKIRHRRDNWVIQQDIFVHSEITHVILHDFLRLNADFPRRLCSKLLKIGLVIMLWGLRFLLCWGISVFEETSSFLKNADYLLDNILYLRKFLNLILAFGNLLVI